MKCEFDLTLFDDASVHEKVTVMNKLEAMFDDARNVLPENYFYFSDEIDFGTTIHVTFEVKNVSL